MDERERQYREYLALREESRRNREESHRPRSEDFGQDDFRSGDFRPRYNPHNSIEDSPYGNSEMRRRRQSRDRQREEYLQARERSGNRRDQEYGYYPEYEEAPHKKGRKKAKKAKKKKRRNLPKVVSIVIVGLCALVAGTVLMAVAALGSMDHIALDKNNLGIDPGVAAQLDGYRNIAVLGTDARAGDENSNCRSDAIIVASINEETDEVKLFSVYRDTLLDVGNEGLDKITHAYFYGGPQQSVRALNRNLDLNIDEVVVINWKTVADAIDAVGGIEVDIQESEIDEMNKFIPETAKNVDGPSDKISQPGKQRLNGVQAVTYSRIRKDAATGDYRRNERMKIVFSETFKEVKGAGPFKMLNVARKSMPEIKTNIGVVSMLGLMAKVKSFDMTDSTTGFPYEVASWTGYAAAGYAWYGPPKNLVNNVSKLHEQFFDQQGYSPSETVHQISNDISYKTGIY